jgi:HD-like signal output (HDOD) protein
VGKLVLLQGAGEERYGIESLDYASLLERRVGTCGGVHLMEQAALGFDHAALGCAALRAWNIPEPIPQLVGWHHSVPRARQEGGRMAELVYLLRVADCLTHAFTGPRLDDEANQAATREPAAMAGLGLNAERLEAFIPQLQYAHAAAPGLLD